MDPEVSVIILNWNGWQDTLACLGSLYHIDYGNYRVILVDNASTDDSLAKIDSHCKNELKLTPHVSEGVIRNKPAKVVHYNKTEVDIGTRSSGAVEQRADHVLTVILNDQNYGFAEGNNIGVSYALNEFDPDYILLLNNDTLVDRHFLSALVDVAERDEQVGLVHAEFLPYDYAITDKNLNVQLRHNVHVRSDDEGEGEGLRFASGSCVLIRKNVLNAFSGECFDPHLFAYYEDVDLSWMARLLDFKVVHSQESLYYHKGEASFGARNPYTAYLNHRNMLRVMIKNYSLATLVLVVPFLLEMKLVWSLISCSSKRELSEPIGFLKALIWNVLQLRSTIVRRRCIQSQRKVSDRDIWPNIVPYNFDVLENLKGLHGH